MSLLEHLKHEIMLLDGAMGTELMRRGVEIKNYTLVNYLDGCIVEKIHKDYINAGADIITTNSFSGTRTILEKASEETVDDNIVSFFNEEAVELAKLARKGKNVYIAGSIGPTGELELKQDEVQTLFREQGKALQDVDFYLIETMYNLTEALLAVEAVKEYHKPVAVSFQLVSGKTIYGDTISKIAVECEMAGVNILGINCVDGIEKAIEYTRELKQHTKLPLIVYPNAGMPDQYNNYPETPEDMAKKLPELLDIGVSIVGGCCGTTPEHIRTFRKVLNEYKVKHLSK